MDNFNPVLMTDDIQVSAGVPADSHKIEYTENMTQHIKVPADSFKAGGKVSVAIVVNKKIGEGRRANVGQIYCHAETEQFVQNVYFS